MDSLELQQKRKIKVTDLQRSMIVGTILGDGHVLKTTMGYCLRLKHSLKQRELLKWKYDILNNIATPIKVYKDSCYFRTVTHPVFSEYRKMFYDENKSKRIPSNLINVINQVALATWIMDDGTNELGYSKSLRINTQCFSLTEHKKLQQILQVKFGIISTLNKDKDMYRLRIAKSSMDKLISLVNPYIIPSMLYKLSP
ncbi:MAG: hypothetical protein AAB721_01360 [Patescibacteria group bacterium]